jgi:hypothetical protein
MLRTTFERLFKIELGIIDGARQILDDGGHFTGIIAVFDKNQGGHA